LAADASADFRCHDYTLILICQVRDNERGGLAPFDAVVEVTVQRARPVILTALAAILVFIPPTPSVSWAPLAFTVFGGTFAGTVLTIVFLPALYAIWFKIRPVSGSGQKAEPALRALSVAG
jgi:multidrug efflux pump subunit AcrB